MKCESCEKLKKELQVERELRQAAAQVAVSAVQKRDMAGAVLRELQRSIEASIARFKGQI